MTHNFCNNYAAEPLFQVPQFKGSPYLTFNLKDPKFLFCVVFIVCNASFTVCVALCAVFCLSVVCYFM
jgi:hypothetical protein